MYEKADNTHISYSLSTMKRIGRPLGQEAFMAISSAFYTAFGPAMDVLQQKGEPKKKCIIKSLYREEEKMSSVQGRLIWQFYQHNSDMLFMTAAGWGGVGGEL